MLYGPVEYPFALADTPATWLAVGLFGGILKLGPVLPVAPYGEPGRLPLATLLANGFGVFRNAGLVFADAVELVVGIERLGLLPASVASDGFRDQANISEPGIFQPLLHPD